MPRQRNHRVVFLEVFTDLIRDLAGAGARWKWMSKRTVYVPQEDREPGDNTWHRNRRPEEYPEAKADEWLRMARLCRQAADVLDKLARFADRQHAQMSESPGQTAAPTA